MNLFFNTVFLFLLSLPIVFSAGFASAVDLAEAGAEVYRRYCIGCHGVKGDGQGPASRLLVVKPRDFSTGIFEFKSTPPGSLPTDEDLMRTITRGLTGNSMPSYALLPETERRALIEYIKTFSGRWRKEKPPAPIALPPVPDGFGTPDSIEKGRAVYLDSGCSLCHGEEGDGQGPVSATLMDDRGNPDFPRSFAWGLYEGGDSPRDVYRLLKTGMEGTPMPEYSYIPEEDLWNLIAFLLSLKEGP